VRKSTEQLTKIFEDITSKAESSKDKEKEDSPFTDLNDDDIESLFK
jgi:hypothetical protein